MAKFMIETNFYVSLCGYTLKKLGFMNDPVDEDYFEYSQKLSTLGKDFRFCAPLAGGPIFTLVYQMPGYLSPNRKEELEEIEQVLIDFVDQKSIEPFIKRFPEHTRYFSSWYQEGWMNHLFATINENLTKVKETIRLFLHILHENWDQYTPLFQEKISGLAITEWQKKLVDIEPFKRWKQLVNTDYPYDEFHFIMCPETSSTASSLGPEKVVIGAKYSLNVFINSLIHEIGVRWMNLPNLNTHVETAGLMERDYMGMIMLIETEVCYQKPFIYPMIKNDFFIPGMRLEELMAWRKNQKVHDISPKSFAILYQNAKKSHLI